MNKPNRYKILGRHGCNAHNSDMLKLLGVTKARLPKEGMPVCEVQGVKNHSPHHLNVEGVQIRVWVKPANVANGGKHGSRPHRIMCACPGCDQEMSIGRLHQHACYKGVAS